MSSSPEYTAKRLLQMLAEINYLLKENAIELRRLKNVSRVLNSCEVIKYTSESALEAYLDAELKDGKGISWLVDITWNDEEWVIRRTLVRSTPAGQDTIKELPTTAIGQFDSFVTSLPSAVAELLALRIPELDQELPTNHCSI